MITSYPGPGEDPRGGVEQSVTRLVAALARAGAEITVIAPGRAGTFDREGVTVVYVGGHGRWALARGLRPWRQAAGRAVASAGGDVVHGQGLLPGGIAVADAPHPRVVTAHGNVGADTRAAYGGLTGSARRVARDRLARAATRRADVLVGVHPDWRQNVPIPPRSFVHIPNIVDDLFFSAERRPDGSRVLFCGGPARIKGWDVLARAWPGVLERCPEASLKVAGWPAGATPPKLPDGTPVETAGWLSSPALRAAMEQASLLAIPSRFEVAPLVLLEAWAARLPVVATSAGGLATLARGAAEVVPPEDPQGLGSAIASVLGGEQRGLDELVAEGSRRAERCRAAAVAEEHLSLYSKLLAR
jgi:glycogen synthase